MTVTIGRRELLAALGGAAARLDHVERRRVVWARGISF
jgi:hypothetical protein